MRAGADDDCDDFGGDDDDDDLAAARQTLAMAKEKKKAASSKGKQTSANDNNDDDDGVYRAPRMAAVPYHMPSKSDRVQQKEEERAQRQRRRMRTSELAETLRGKYGDRPEQDDMHGGSQLGKQQSAARNLAMREAQRTAFEEDAFVRLTPSRKEKKERNALMRAEASNLNAISDLGNLVRDAANFSRDGDVDEDDGGRHYRGGRGGVPFGDNDDLSTRYSNGKRKKRHNDDGGGSRSGGRDKEKGGGRLRATNALQEPLFGGGSSRSGKKKKRSK